jgi:hypothetical protein
VWDSSLSEVPHCVVIVFVALLPCVRTWVGLSKGPPADRNLSAAAGFLQGIRYDEEHRGELQLPIYVVYGINDAATDISVSNHYDNSHL